MNENSMGKLPYSKNVKFHYEKRYLFCIAQASWHHNVTLTRNNEFEKAEWFKEQQLKGDPELSCAWPDHVTGIHFQAISLLSTKMGLLLKTCMPGSRAIDFRHLKQSVKLQSILLALQLQKNHLSEIKPPEINL